MLWFSIHILSVIYLILRRIKRRYHKCTVHRSSRRALFTLDARLLASSQYPEGPATGHLDTGFSRFPCVYKQTLRRFPTFQVATTCFSCSPPDFSVLNPWSIFMCMHNNHCHWAAAICSYSSLKLLIIIFINGNWVVTRWPSLFYMYTKYEAGY